MDIERDLNDLRRTGVMTQAVALRVQPDVHFNASVEPQYFTGDLRAPFVLVHLNPKMRDLSDADSSVAVASRDVDDYIQRFSEFGRRHYGPGSDRQHVSPFDAKQVRFLRAFGAIDFVDETAADAKYTNLERVVDRKLQLELVPYGSDTFPSGPFKRDPSLLQPHIERILEVITRRPRTHVIFCGTVFEGLLRDVIEGPVQYEKFSLSKVGGGRAKTASRFAPITLQHGGCTITAGIAPSFAQQGINMAAYGEEVCRRYGQ